MALAVPVIQNARAVLEDELGCSTSHDNQPLTSTVLTMTRAATTASTNLLNVPGTEEWQQTRWEMDKYLCCAQPSPIMPAIANLRKRKFRRESANVVNDFFTFDDDDDSASALFSDKDLVSDKVFITDNSTSYPMTFCATAQSYPSSKRLHSYIPSYSAEFESWVTGTNGANSPLSPAWSTSTVQTSSYPVR
ncbi:predicted protein [Nematostella vectensis]|uniref:Uncharacterized protein n=1 Tax=Nematostella vectensis TaxID=45351 RepID=A7S779_NEMVE|nr:predicted protein [Nematostella vectensis]|eukprot:XP_001632513.1 predicted protein [Nematostella vectensis]